MPTNKKRSHPQGLFITLEGPDGSGKSTQLALLKDRLASQGIPFILTREPGGGSPNSLAEKIRQLVLEPSPASRSGLRSGSDPASQSGPLPMCPQTELLLFLAARAQHVREVILPALAAGRLVLCERFADATLAYQAGGRGLPQAFVKNANRFASQGIEPDLTLLLDISSRSGLKRAFSSKGGHDRMEAESLAFHQRVRRVYLQIARSHPKRVKVIQADQPLKKVAERIWEIASAEIYKRLQTGSK